MQNPSRFSVRVLWVALTLSLCVGILGRGFWTPDEPREADIAWRMSWQTGKAVPLLAGEAFCEKPPLAYWAAGAAIRVFGTAGWAARLPNVLYALVTALAVGMIGRRGAGPLAGMVAAAAVSTFLLTYQVSIWLATDAPLLAATAVALLGAYVGFYAERSIPRLTGYTCMHAALAVGFLSKSAAAWMVPALTIGALIAWERRWRELLRWELYAGLIIQLVAISSWIWFVYSSPDGTAHLKVFFWNNLVGRFAHVDAPQAFQYAAAHRNSPGKYLLELPVYLWPWTLLVVAAARRAWQRLRARSADLRLVRFAIAAFLPALAVLSVAATARNIYLAPALPGAALLLGWWVRDLLTARDRWDLRAIRGTSLLMAAAVIVLACAVTVSGWESWDTLDTRLRFMGISALGIGCGAALTAAAWRAVASERMPRAFFALALAYCALLIGPASQIYGRVDAWQDLAAIGRSIRQDYADRPLILLAPDETTRAFVDMYARTVVELVPDPASEATAPLLAALSRRPRSVVLAQIPGRSNSLKLRALASRAGLDAPRGAQPARLPDWAVNSHLSLARVYALPNGRRYALFAVAGPVTSR